MANEIVLYQPNEQMSLEVKLENETVWLNRQQLSILFDRDVKTIGKHINNALKEELYPVVAKSTTTGNDSTSNATVAKFAIVQKEGNREVIRQVEFYSLDVILSVGYRVKSSRGIEFRRWANQVLKDYMLKGYAINQQMLAMEERIGRQLQDHTIQIHNLQEKVNFFVRTSLPPHQGIFYDGQIFDAYTFINDRIREATTRIILIDNYIDDSVLTMLAKRADKVAATIYTKKPSAQLQLDIQKHNAQYPPIEFITFDRSHDRFLCIDETVYHLGASIKDLGKKWFAFNRMEMPTSELLQRMQ
jgi:hypothetical protein